MGSLEDSKGVDVAMATGVVVVTWSAKSEASSRDTGGAAPWWSPAPGSAS